MSLQPESPIRAGKMLPSLILPEAGGDVVNLWDFHGRKNLVIVFVADPGRDAGRDILHQLTGSYDDVREQETELLIVFRASLPQAVVVKRDLGLRGRVLVDEAGHAFQRYGLHELAVIIADRYGEISFTADARDQEIPSIDEILNWIRFIQSQCPE